MDIKIKAKGLGIDEPDEKTPPKELSALRLQVTRATEHQEEVFKRLLQLNHSLSLRTNNLPSKLFLIKYIHKPRL